ncbi:MAG: acyltransferase family protein [Nitrosomonadaceae bacterium]
MNYRREIDGLRALAVIPVIFFHAGFQAFSGGFVGVDVFFVISGYLITSIIITEKSSGKFTLTKFYERRARRILPALFFIMLVCLPFSWLWLLPSNLNDFSKSLIVVPIFSSNFLFINQSGYFDTAIELKPLIHTWSLAVEEQYYLLFPIFISFLWYKCWPWAARIIFVVALISLIFSNWGAHNYPTATFYLLPTRIWELFIGSLIALYLFNHNQNLLSERKTSSVLGIVGLLLIVFSIITFDEGTPFPSFYALIPTIGTALIILFASQNEWVGKWLGNKLFVGLGLISYSAYLWHQPLFAFARIRSFSVPTTGLLLSLSLLAIFLAYLSWKYVEKPFRDKNKFSQKQIFIFSLIGSLFFIGLGITGNINKGFGQRFTVPQSIADALAAKNQNPSIMNCFKNFNKDSPEIDTCFLGDPKGKNSEIAVFGDSHAIALLPAFDDIGKKVGKSIAHIGLGGCPSLLDVWVLKGNFETGVCKKLAQRQLAYVKDHEIKKVFLVSRWTTYTDGNYEGKKLFHLALNRDDSLDKSTSRKAFEQGLNKTIKAYKDLGAEVYIVAQVPQQLRSTKEFYYSMYDSNFADVQKSEFIRKYSVPTFKHAALQSYTRRLFDAHVSRGEIKLINLDSIFCDNARCIFGTVKQPYYVDADHLSIFGSNLTIPKIIEFAQ